MARLSITEIFCLAITFFPITFQLEDNEHRTLPISSSLYVNTIDTIMASSPSGSSSHALSNSLSDWLLIPQFINVSDWILNLIRILEADKDPSTTHLHHYDKKDILELLHIRHTPSHLMRVTQRLANVIHSVSAAAPMLMIFYCNLHLVCCLDTMRE